MKDELLSCKVILTSRFVENILRLDHSNETFRLWQYFDRVLFVFYHFSQRNLGFLSYLDFSPLLVKGLDRAI